ncbi:MAG: FKBP-type peptidyl-prolyl cis-trans isomerase [Bacteroidetes bacterium]|nr:FKBP-type peptidyl-prolyl cis-trans isomerase [Bacteroidota bacterium]
MKRFLIGFVSLLLVAGAATGAAFAFNGGEPAKEPERKYKSKKVRKPKTIKTASGLEYTITAKGNGPQAGSGYRLTVLYTGKLTNDTVFDASSRHGNTPFTYKVGAGRVIKGWDEAGALLRAGDKVTLRIPPELGYGAQQMPNIPANSTLVFEIEVLDVQPPPVKRDAKGMDTVTTASGLKIVFFEKHPENPLAKPGQRVKVNYSGYLTDGKMFDSSFENGAPIQVMLGKGQVIKGWDEGLALMRVGEKAQFIIPPGLAYGNRAMGSIPANSTLIFDVDLLSAQ